MNEIEFKNRKPNIQKLLSFGFTAQNDGYAYAVDLLDGQFEMTILVEEDGKVNTKVTDSSKEEYVLHLVESAVGAFVGQVRAEYEDKLEEISAKCFDLEIFKSKQAKRVIAYVRDRYGDELEYLWAKFPDNAIIRRKDTQKWYAALLTVSRRKLGLDSDEMVEILDLRMKPEDIETVVDSKKYFPGYHMNKKHWISICLDETVSFDEICNRMDNSYALAMQ